MLEFIVAVLLIAALLGFVKISLYTILLVLVIIALAVYISGARNGRWRI